MGYAARIGLRWKWVRYKYPAVLRDYPDKGCFVALRNRNLKVALCTLANPSMFQWRKNDEEMIGGDRNIQRGAPVSEEAKEVIFSRIDRALEEAMRKQCAILVFPELCVSEGKLQYIASKLNKSKSLYPFLVVAGTRHVKEDNGLFRNRCTVLDWNGNTLTWQDKRHPYDFELEGETYIEPTEYTTRVQYVDSEIGRIVFAICNDYIIDEAWGAMSASLCLVPAMSHKLRRFEDRAKHFADDGLCTIVCNADDKSESASADRWWVYRPARRRAFWPPISRGKRRRAVVFSSVGAAAARRVKIFAEPTFPELLVAEIDLCWNRDLWSSGWGERSGS